MHETGQPFGHGPNALVVPEPHCLPLGCGSVGINASHFLADIGARSVARLVNP